VILESGTPGTSVLWSAWVQPDVAKTTRVCAYDRAGLGWSKAGPGPRDARQIASELHTLLENAGIEGPTFWWDKHTCKSTPTGSPEKGKEEPGGPAHQEVTLTQDHESNCNEGSGVYRA